MKGLTKVNDKGKIKFKDLSRPLQLATIGGLIYFFALLWAFVLKGISMLIS